MKYERVCLLQELCKRCKKNPNFYSILKHNVVQDSGENETLKEESLKSR